MIASTVRSSIFLNFLIAIKVYNFAKVIQFTSIFMPDFSQNNHYILGIESSCDDTAAAVVHNGWVLSNLVASQKIHQQYGGVVPELASRAHQQNIVPVVHQALQQANIGKKDLSAIAFTQGPGLMGSLLVGSSFAKSLAWGLGIPLIEVNHMQAHILAHFIKNQSKNPQFPFLALTISGGHTQIVLVRDYFSMEILGQTLDDAAGEAFDKTAKILGLPYPGGPLIDQYAQQGDPYRFKFTQPKAGGLNFSFSGLKTAVLYFIQQKESEQPGFIQENLHDICASVQHTIVSYLMNKLQKAVQQTGINQIAIGGGVSANSGIRKALQQAEREWEWITFVPPLEYCTDNAAMIAITGYLKYQQGEFSDLTTVSKARLEF